jgi:hypothetical protein
LPEIPEPKARSKARYTVVLINEAGRSRQIEISPLGLRVGSAAVCAVVVLVIVAAVAAGGYRMGGSVVSSDQEALTGKVASLEEELRKKELALTVQEKRLKEMQELPTMVAGPSQGAESERSGETGSDDSTLPASDHGPLTAMRPAESGSGTGQDTSETLPIGSETADTPPAGDSQYPRYAEREASKSAGDSTPRAGRSIQSPDLIEFNAEDVTAAANAPNNGTLRFKLVKNRPDLRFSGYLFVYVEMEDSRGESRLYAYPKDARRGEEDLPTDFRQGESVAFKKNSLVELPYKDTRAGASLSGVSILIYDADGKIVFQRRFDRKDLQVVESRKGDSKGAGPRGTRRQAL